MSGINLDTKPFLSEEQEGWLQEVRELSHRLEFPNGTVDGEVHLRERLGDLHGHAIDSFPYIFKTSAIATSTKPVDSTEDLVTRLQNRAVIETYASITLRSLGFMTAVVAGYYEATNESSPDLQKFGHGVLLKRAQRQLHAWIGACNNIFYGEDLTDETGSLWERAIETHAKNRRLKPPVAINDDEINRFMAILHKAEGFQPEQPFKIGRSQTLNIIRAAKYARKKAKEVRADPSLSENLEVVLEHFEALRTPDYSFEDVQAGARTALRVKRYMENAAKADDVIAADPRARYIVYLSGQLDGHDLRSENAVFDRDVRKFANMQRRFDKQHTAEPKSK